MPLLEVSTIGDCNRFARAGDDPHYAAGFEETERVVYYRKPL